MATRVYDTVDIALQDGTEVTLAPLPIGQLRRFMKRWSEFKNLEDENLAYDIFSDCVGIALETQLADRFEETKGKGDEILSTNYKTFIERVVDMETTFKVMEVCGGLKLNDPNLLAAVAAANVEDGTS